MLYMYQCKTPQPTDWWDKAIRPGLFIPIPPLLMPQALPVTCTLPFFRCETRQYRTAAIFSSFYSHSPRPHKLNLHVQCQMCGTEMDFYFQFTIQCTRNSGSWYQQKCLVRDMSVMWSVYGVGGVLVLPWEPQRVCHVGHQRVQEPSLRRI